MSGISFDKKRKVSYYMDNNHLSFEGSSCYIKVLMKYLKTFY